MKRLFFLLISISWIGPGTAQTAENATRAMDAFNRNFYNPKEQLYYPTTKKEGTAAIWTQAIYWDMIMNAYQRTHKPEYRQLIDAIYQGGYNKYDRYNWENKKEWFIYDDMMWWIISLARAYEITNNPIYLETSISGFDRVWRDAYDSENGGMFWSFDHKGKNACINYPTVIAAMTLYTITRKTGYLDKAKRVYRWSHDNLFSEKTGRVADHKIGNNRPGYEDYTYNQGTCIGAAVMLYLATNEKSYLDDAILAADYTRDKMCNAEGILPAEGDWNEQGVLKAIFAQYIVRLIEDAQQTQYLPWIKKNITLAWENRDKTRDITYRNYTIPCPTGDIQSYEASSAVAFMQLFFDNKHSDNQ